MYMQHQIQSLHLAEPGVFPGLNLYHLPQLKSGTPILSPHSFKYFYIAFKIPQIVQILYYSGYYPPNPAISAVWRSLSHACLISPACWYVIFSGFDLTIRFLSSDKSALSDERMLLSSFFPELW